MTHFSLRDAWLGRASRVDGGQPRFRATPAGSPACSSGGALARRKPYGGLFGGPEPSLPDTHARTQPRTQPDACIRDDDRKAPGPLRSITRILHSLRRPVFGIGRTKVRREGFRTTGVFRDWMIRLTSRGARLQPALRSHFTRLRSPRLSRAPSLSRSSRHPGLSRSWRRRSR